MLSLSVRNVNNIIDMKYAGLNICITQNLDHLTFRRYNPAYPEDMTIFTRTPVCYKCDKSDKGGRPLIFCSYCPLAYHLDCLYPPLPFRPTGLWMCPAHPQYLVPGIHTHIQYTHIHTYRVPGMQLPL